MLLKFNAYDEVPAVDIEIADKALRRKENFNWTIKISDTYNVTLGQTGTSPIGKFIVKSASYVNAGTLELTLTTFPSDSSISKVQVIGQSKAMPGSQYTANFTLPEIKTYENYQTLEGIPSDWFTDHLVVHSSISPAGLGKIIKARKDYVDAIKELLQMVTKAQDGVFGQLLKVSNLSQILIQTGEGLDKFSEVSADIVGFDGLTWSGPMTGFTFDLRTWESKSGYSGLDIATYANDLTTIYNTPMDFNKPNTDSGVVGNEYLMTPVLPVTLSDFEVMSGNATIRIGTYNITLDLTKLPFDAQDSNRNNTNILYIQLLARTDYRPDGQTQIIVNYGFDNKYGSAEFNDNQPFDASLTIPHKKMQYGENPIATAALASLQVPFNGMSVAEMSFTVVKSYLQDAYSFGNGDGQINTENIAAIIASIVAVVGTFAVSPVAGAGLGAILLSMAIESNIPVLRIGQLDKLAGGVLQSYGIPTSQVRLEGDAPRQSNGAVRARDLNLYYNTNAHVNTSVPKLITTKYIEGDYAKWAKRPRELRQPITRDSTKSYPTPFTYWGVEAIAPTPDPNVKQALGYLNTGDL